MANTEKSEVRVKLEHIFDELVAICKSATDDKDRELSTLIMTGLVLAGLAETTDNDIPLLERTSPQLMAMSDEFRIAYYREYEDDRRALYLDIRVKLDAIIQNIAELQIGC